MNDVFAHKQLFKVIEQLSYYFEHVFLHRWEPTSVLMLSVPGSNYAGMYFKTEVS